MTRTRRLARRAIAAIAAAFVVFLGVSYRAPGPRARRAHGGVADTLRGELDPAVRDQLRFQGFVYESQGADQGTFRLRASEAIGFRAAGDMTFRLKDLVFESREKAEGPEVTITAPRAEFTQGTKALRVFDGFRLGGAETGLRGEAFRYDPVRKTFTSSGPVTAIHGELVGAARAGELGTKQGSLVLTGDVRMHGPFEGRPLDLAAPSVTLLKKGDLHATGGVVAKAGDFVLRAAELDRQIVEGGDLFVARGGARLLLSPVPPRLAAAARAEGDEIQLTRNEAGEPTTFSLVRAGDARIDLAPAPGAGARRFLSARLEGTLAAGKLASLSAPERLSTYESSRPEAPGSAQDATAGSGRVSFLADGSSLDVASFEGGVAWMDGNGASLLASRGTIRGADETAVFTGDSGRPAEYRDPRGTLHATSLTYQRKPGQLDASGEVKGMFRAGGETGLPGGEPGEPVFSESDLLTLLVREKKMTLSGHVRAWQKENVLRCATLTLDDPAKTLRAQGDVKAFLRRKPQATTSKGGSAASETVNASGELLTYRERERTVRIEGQSSVQSGPWVTNADILDLKLGADRSIEYAESRGTVVLEDRALKRRGEGTKAVWRAQTDTMTLEGSPALALDGKGNRLNGAKLTFRQGQSRVEVESAGDVPIETVLKPEGSS